jgi:multidrug efflux pump subunit AcrA (membrane-fusion protein)
VSGTPRRPGGTAAASDDALWTAFAEAGLGPDALGLWLALLCRELPGATLGLVLLPGEGGGFAPAAIWPDRIREVGVLTAAAERTIAERQAVIVPPLEEAAVRRVVGYPVEDGEALAAILVVECAVPASGAAEVLRRIHWAIGWLEALTRETGAGAVRRKAARAAAALDVLAAAGEQAGFDAIAFAVVNELARTIGCGRVSLGLVEPRGLRLAATSHAAWFDRRADLVAAIEAAMEEAAFQNRALRHPRAEGAPGQVDVAHRTLAGTWGARGVATALFRDRGRVRGALTAERTSGEPFSDEDVATLELSAALLGPLLAAEARDRRLVSGRLRAGAGRLLDKIVGPRHPAAKLSALAAILVLLGLALVEGEFRITARSVLEGSVQRAAVAPFEGFVREAPVRAGDLVKAGDLMAVLDDRDLRFERLKWSGEREKLVQRQREAIAKNDRAGFGVIAAQLGQSDAEIALVDEKLKRTRVTAPIDGVVVSGDLSQTLGAPVETGRVLFEVAPLDGYRVALQVSEFDVRHVAVGQEGTLVLAGMGGEPLPLRVTKVTPVSTPQDGRNAFRVEAAIEGAPHHLRPGMEGVAKVRAGEERLLWIWSRPILERLRLLVWTWTP